MKFSNPDILMMEAFLDRELDEEDVPKIMDKMNTHPEFKQLYDILKDQKHAIKCAFLSDNKTH
jgi:hypothetical protein